MTWPAGIGTCTVTGEYLDGAGTPLASGTVWFTYPGYQLIDGTDKVIVTGGTVGAAVTNGRFSIVLPFTNNADVAPSGWSYMVSEQLPSGLGTQYFLPLPTSTGPTADIANLVRQPNPTYPTWPTAPFIPLADVTAKGDVLGGTGNGTVARIAVGTDGQVLAANSGTTTGLSWITPSGSTPGNVTPQTAFGLASSNGAAATYARSDHVHGTPSLLDHHARMHGLVGEPFPVEVVNHVDLGASSGFLILALIRPGAGTVTNVGLWLGTAGVTPNGVNAMALFDETGNQLGVTGDMSAALSNVANDNVYVEAALGTPVPTAEATNYYVGLLCHMATNPLIAGVFAGSGLMIPTMKGHRASLTVAAQATVPASFNVSTASAASAAYWLVAS